jgi:hypothetical protein
MAGLPGKRLPRPSQIGRNAGPHFRMPFPQPAGIPMTSILRAVAVALFALAAFPIGGAAPAAAQIKQIKLTEKQVQSYIAAQKEMIAVADKIGDAEKPDAKALAQLEAVAKKHGFKNYAEYEDVATNISIVVTGLDPQTKAFTQPPEVIKREIAAINGDNSIPAEEKKQALAELNDALKTAKPVQFPENVELVKKYYDRIEAVMQEPQN